METRWEVVFPELTCVLDGRAGIPTSPMAGRLFQLDHVADTGRDALAGSRDLRPSQRSHYHYSRTGCCLPGGIRVRERSASRIWKALSASLCRRALDSRPRWARDRGERRWTRSVPEALGLQGRQIHLGPPCIAPWGTFQAYGVGCLGTWGGSGRSCPGRGGGQARAGSWPSGRAHRSPPPGLTPTPGPKPGLLTRLSHARSPPSRVGHQGSSCRQKAKVLSPKEPPS